MVMALANANREKFCQEYLRDGHGTKAAIRAGYSQHSARAKASQLLKHEDVRGRIAELQAARSERTQITVDMVVDGLYAEATRQGKDSTHSARVQAWTQLGKHLGMFVERLDVNHSLEVRFVPPEIVTPTSLTIGAAQTEERG